MRIVFSDDAQDFQRRNWSGLVHEDPAGTFFHQPAFLKLYWEEFGETLDDLLLAFGEDDAGAQVGAVAFERSGDTLRFLGGVEITDCVRPGRDARGEARVRRRAVGGAARARGLGDGRPVGDRGGLRVVGPAR
jgi:hypothetical protein